MLIQPLYRSDIYCTKPQKGNTVKDKHALQRMNDFMADPGPVPFRHETVAEAQRYMAEKIREFDFQFGIDSSSSRQ